MALLSEPERPPASSYYIFYHYLEAQSDWRKFIPGWEQYEVGRRLLSPLSEHPHHTRGP